MVHFADIPPKPVIRIGWIQAVPCTMDRFADAVVTFSGVGFNHFASALVKEVIDMDLLEENICRLRSTYSERADAMDRRFGSTSATWSTTRSPHAATTSGSAFPAGWTRWSFCPQHSSAASLLDPARRFPYRVALPTSSG